jgi:serine/threonine protein phosphatase PrpC
LASSADERIEIHRERDDDMDREITAPLVVEELRAGWAAKAAGHPRMAVRLLVGAKTDMGRVREHNEDKFETLEPEDPGVLALKGRFYAVADGMGGHSAGQIASELALKTAFRAYYNDPSTDPEASLRHALEEANAYLLEVAKTIADRNGMGTTFTGAVVRDDDLFVVHVGDSRLYHLGPDRIDQLTADHSWVAEQVRRGALTEEEANASPFRNVITRTVGATPELEPDLLRLKLERGDRFLFCSDGLNSMLPNDEILRWGLQGSPSVAAWNLIELANQYGGKDNITVLILDVQDVRPWPENGEAGEIGETFTAEAQRTPRETNALLSKQAVHTPEHVRDADPAGPKPHRSVAGWMRWLFGRA